LYVAKTLKNYKRYYTGVNFRDFKHMKVIFFDTGRNSGYAVHTPGDGWIIGEKNLPYDLGERYYEFEKLVKSNKWDLIAYEKVNRHLGTAAAHQYGAYEGIILKCAFENGTEVIPIYVQTIKKRTGHVGKPKEQMKEECIKRYKHILPADATTNMVDAFIGCIVALEKAGQKYDIGEDDVVS